MAVWSNGVDLNVGVGRQLHLERNPTVPAGKRGVCGDDASQDAGQDGAYYS